MCSQQSLTKEVLTLNEERVEIPEDTFLITFLFSLK